MTVPDLALARFRRWRIDFISGVFDAVKVQRTKTGLLGLLRNQSIVRTSKCKCDNQDKFSKTENFIFKSNENNLSKRKKTHGSKAVNMIFLFEYMLYFKNRLCENEDAYFSVHAISVDKHKNRQVHRSTIRQNLWAYSIFNLSVYFGKNSCLCLLKTTSPIWVFPVPAQS